MGGIRKRTDDPRLVLLVPGDPETRTGGYIYDRRVVDGMRRGGWHCEVYPLNSSFPRPTADALRLAGAVFASLPDGCTVVVDGLAFGCMPEVLQPESERLRLVALIHHPLALETGLDEHAGRRFRESERFALAFARRVIVTSQWTARALAGYGVAPEKIRVVEPGVDAPPLAHHSPGPRPADARLELLCVATVTRRKGHAVLVNALARLKERNWRLQCVGSLEREPETALALRSQIERLELGGRIDLRGEVEAGVLATCYSNADVFVLASFMEGYGMVLSEALVHGLPIVSTRAGAIPETVPPQASLLVDPGDDLALARALATLMDDPERLCRLSANAAIAGGNLPNWDHASMKFAQALAALEGNRP